jgi:hypothetical protein
MQSQTPIATALGGTVAVAPTDTTLIAATRLTRGQRLVCCVVNNAGDAQTLAAWGETGPTNVGPWSESIGMGLDTVQDGKSATGDMAVKAPQWARVRGTSSGAGLNAAVYGWTLADHP